MVERNSELLGGDLRHGRARAGADVLHRGHDLCAAVGADADPRVRGRAAPSVPDLRGEADAVLPGALPTGADIVALGPVRFRAPVALGEVLRGERAVVGAVGIGVV